MAGQLCIRAGNRRPLGRTRVSGRHGKDEKMSDIAERVKKIVVEHLGVEAAQVKEDAKFIDDLGADSLDTVELVMAIQAFDTSDLATKIAGEVPLGDKANGHFNADTYILPKDQRKLDKFLIFGIAAAQQAVEDSGWKPQDDEGRNRTGVMIGAGIGGLQTIYETSLVLKERGPRRVSPFFIPSALINLASGQVSIK